MIARDVATRCEPSPSPYAGVRTFLEEYAPALADRAWERIKASEADYGDSYLWTAPRRLVRELEEEIVDAAGWAALTFVRLQRDEGIADSDRVRASALLAAIAAASAKTDLLVEQLRPLIESA